MYIKRYRGYGLDLARLKFQNEDYAKNLRLLMHPAFLKQAVLDFNEQSDLPLTLLITHNHDHNIYLYVDQNANLDNPDSEKLITQFIADSIWNNFKLEHDTEYPYLKDEFQRGILNELIKQIGLFTEISDYEFKAQNNQVSYPKEYRKFEVVK